jgi:hypothetical protein
MLTFNTALHEYKKLGKTVPSVTQVINEWLKVAIGGEKWHVNRFTGVAIPSRKMDEGAAKGADLHKGCNLILQGGIDWDSLAEEYVPPLRQFEQWLKDFDIQPLYSELMVYNSRMGYAGTIDLVVPIDKALAFIDIKTGECGTVGPQLAAYEKAYCDQEKYVGRTARYALWLPKSGKPYKFEKLTNEGDWDFFKSCLFQKGHL